MPCQLPSCDANCLHLIPLTFTRYHLPLRDATCLHAVLLNRTAIDLKAIANWFQPMGRWLNWDPLQTFSGDNNNNDNDNDKQIKFWQSHWELLRNCQLSAGRELAQSFSAAIAKA